MHWILQNNLFNEAAYQTLLDTIKRFDLPYSIHRVIPFVGELLPDPMETLTHDNVICMGSYSLRHVAKKNMWTPGVFDLEPFNFQEQLKHWGDHMLNADSVVCQFGEAQVTADYMFIRPIEDSKAFAGKVFSREEFNDWQQKVCVLEHDYGTPLSKTSLIQLSTPKEIYAEYRFWIVEGRIITASLYKRGDCVFYENIPEWQEPRLYAYVRARIGEWQPHQAFVIDICETPDGLRIVEINTLNSCGFYAADIAKLVEALEFAFNDTSIVPDPDTKQYQAIVNAGCSQQYSHEGEFECLHRYEWPCEECPVATEAMADDQDDGYIILKGPNGKP